MLSEQDIINKALNTLQIAASDEEALIVERLAIAAGYWWQCNPDGCHYVNNADDTECGGCGRNKPA